MRCTIYFVAAVAAVILVSKGHADESVSLVIDPFTGAAAIRNDADASVSIDGYLVTSAAQPLLDTSQWTSLQDSEIPGWRESAPDTGNRFGELNLFESTAVAPGGSLSIGNPYRQFEPATFGETEPGLQSLDFRYTLAGQGESQRGDVEFSSRNTVVLVVDPSTGESLIQNQSAFDVELDGYLIKSVSETLDADGWTPVSAADAGWLASSGAPNRLAEANLFGATPLAANGGTIALGTPINPETLNDETDLALEITTSFLSSPVSGGILFRSLSNVSADCNGDGTTNILDANCTPENQLDTLLAGLDPPSLRGDADGSGTVEFSDFLTLSGNFGQPGAFTDGDFDLDGEIGFSDFLALSQNFAAAGQTASVPEPRFHAAWIALMGLLARWLVRSRVPVRCTLEGSRQRTGTLIPASI